MDAAAGGQDAQLPGFVDVNTRPADREPAGDGGHRSRSRAGARRHAAADPERAVHRVRQPRRSRTIYAPANQYSVILEVEPQYQRNPDALSKLYVRSSQGSLVPLDAVVATERAPSAR